MVSLFQTLHTLSYVTADRVADRLRTVKEEKGASAVEYAILVGAIALVVAAAVLIFGNKLKALFDGISLGGTPASTPAAPTS
ncbi:Flp family type IVb pilin [Modestobacter sp. VKM Ac-2978]|uniref:Flp family type IVb pilin n=1 Tax=Modestobacter sp. VKM Ac-2978 TaxID=3004132 RepID=UPI0022AAF28E|nr:Flp family type IVb pilin [Modestobacter sp. VKM Ac-2978]MCZ2847119.1 Flp family type IVb pilin [Modestobacter sp. VKM Ac-2978]